MKFKELLKQIEQTDVPVILLEGTRDLPDSDRPKLVELGAELARRFPSARFRTGNATGSDEAFAEGVAAVDAGRLEYVTPYKGHRKKHLAEGAHVISAQELDTVAEKRAAYLTAEASPKYGSMMERRSTSPRVQSKARYLIRDTVKVTGSKEDGLAPATGAIFYVNAEDPMKGGTGHTVRVCEQRGVPTCFQEEWMPRGKG